MKPFGLFLKVAITEIAGFLLAILIFSFLVFKLSLFTIKKGDYKYIVPQQIEKILSESTFIEQIMVVGEGRKFPAALIIPSYENCIDWAKTNDSSLINLPREEFLTHAKIKQLIEDEVSRLNVNFGNWEKIKKFEILPNEFTIETGELTPTLKMKRKIIAEKYKNEIERIYQ